MTRDELLKIFDSEVIKMRTIIEARNTDYAKNSDALYNIKKGGYRGIIAHITDKNARLENLVDGNFQQVRSSEIMEDNCRDIANYAILFIALSHE